MNIANLMVNEQSSIRIISTSKLYFDPFNLPNEPHDADIIFITHEHYDHFSFKDIDKAANEKTIYAFPVGMKATMLKHDIPEEQIYPLVPGQTALIAGLPIQTVAAYNINKPFHPKSNGWLGYVVTVDNSRIYICGDTDDYGSDTEFTLVPHITENTHELLIEIEFNVKCNSIEALIRLGKADYVLHVECSSTAFRIALKSGVPQIQYRIPKSRINGEINLVAMIVAKMDIEQYSSDDLNEDYLEELVCFSKGAILAYQNLPPIYVSKKIEELARNESFITIIKKVSLDPDEIRPLEFNLHSDKIQVMVDQRTYEAFIKHQQTRTIAMAMIVLPTLTFMISEIRDNPEAYERFAWYQQLDKFFRFQNKSFVDDVLRKDDNPVSIAQEMLQNPVSSAYRELCTLEA